MVKPPIESGQQGEGIPYAKTIAAAVFDCSNRLWLTIYLILVKLEIFKGLNPKVTKASVGLRSNLRTIRIRRIFDEYSTN